MTHRISGTSATVALGFLLAGSLRADTLPERVERFGREVPRTTDEMAHPCLVNTPHCLDLAGKPFTVCGLRSERCPQDARYERLRMR